MQMEPTIMLSHALPFPAMRAHLRQLLLKRPAPLLLLLTQRSQALRLAQRRLLLRLGSGPCLLSCLAPPQQTVALLLQARNLLGSCLCLCMSGIQLPSQRLSLLLGRSQLTLQSLVLLRQLLQRRRGCCCLGHGRGCCCRRTLSPLSCLQRLLLRSLTRVAGRSAVSLRLLLAGSGSITLHHCRCRRSSSSSSGCLCRCPVRQCTLQLLLGCMSRGLQLLCPLLCCHQVGIQRPHLQAQALRVALNCHPHRLQAVDL